MAQNWIKGRSRAIKGGETGRRADAVRVPGRAHAVVRAHADVVVSVRRVHARGAVLAPAPHRCNYAQKLPNESLIVLARNTLRNQYVLHNVMQP